MKTCTKCGEAKTPDDFHRNSRMADGRQVYCKPCIRDYKRDWRRADPKNREADTAWRQANPDKVKAIKRRTRRKNAAKIADYDRTRRAEHPDMFKARRAVRTALASGKLTRPGDCECCFEAGPVHGHHDSYQRGQWLRVQWLCPACHAHWHKHNEAES